MLARDRALVHRTFSFGVTPYLGGSGKGQGPQEAEGPLESSPDYTGRGGGSTGRGAVKKTFNRPWLGCNKRFGNPIGGGFKPSV